MYFWNDLLGEIKYYDEKLKVYFIFFTITKRFAFCKVVFVKLTF